MASSTVHPCAAASVALNQFSTSSCDWLCGSGPWKPLYRLFLAVSMAVPMETVVAKLVKRPAFLENYLDAAACRSLLQMASCRTPVSRLLRRGVQRVSGGRFGLHTWNWLRQASGEAGSSGSLDWNEPE